MLPDFDSLSLSILIGIFAVCTLIILIAGTRIAKVAEGLAVKTGLGQAIVGAVFLGISTSLSGTILSFYAAANDHPALAISNAVGGIAAQTFFLAIADLTYRKANLEHAASSLENLMQSGLLVVMLAIPLMTAYTMDFHFLGVHPTSAILIGFYLVGMHWVKCAKDDPLWTAKNTAQTQMENQNEQEDAPMSLKRLLSEFALLAAVTCGIGIALAKTAITLADRTGLNETVIGGFLTSVATSLPELVTTLAAIRRGALNLAVGDIIGGNSFDVLFLAGSDMFYRAGSLYHHMSSLDMLMLSATIFMTGVLIMGMIRRERSGPINIGFESVILIITYALLVAFVWFGE